MATGASKESGMKFTVTTQLYSAQAGVEHHNAIFGGLAVVRLQFRVHIFNSYINMPMSI